MSGTVSAWLRKNGFGTVYAEVPEPIGCRVVDLVAREDDTITAVELKLYCSQAVIQQAYLNQYFAHWSFVAVASQPSSRAIDRCRRFGLGVLRVDKGAVTVIEEAVETDNANRRRSSRNVIALLSRLDRMEPGGVAGKPTLAGEGPAQETWRRVLAYRAKHPQASWAEMFAAVPNHYAHAKSMRQAQRRFEEAAERDEAE